MTPAQLKLLVSSLLAAGLFSAGAEAREDAAAPSASPRAGTDTDRDGIEDACDTCPEVIYDAGFDWGDCPPMDRDPDNDARPECRAREQVAAYLVQDSALIRHIAFAVVKRGIVHFADAFTYIGGGQFVHDPDGIHRLFRVGSTSKPIAAVTARILEEAGALSLEDFVSDDDGTRETDGQRTLRHLLTHQGAFKLDSGALHLYCYPGDLAAFWAEPDDLVSPHYDSPTYGNVGGGYAYSAFNYSLAGAYLANRAGMSYAETLQSRLFDAAGMCTATLDGARAVGTPIGGDQAISQGAVMHVGPYINFVSPTDERCEDNFYSSNDLPGDDYTWQGYYLDEADGTARDPAGGVIASVVDMGHFASALLASYRAPGGLISQAAVRDLWTATHDLGCHPACPYEPYYGIGFFTDSPSGVDITRVEHGGSRAGYKSAFALRPEADLAISILANADTSTVALSNLARVILDDFESASCFADIDGSGAVDFGDILAILGAWGNTRGAEDLDGSGTVDFGDLLVVLGSWGACADGQNRRGGGE